MISLDNEICIFSDELQTALPNSAALLCGICGENHSSRDCTIIRVTEHVPDKQIPSKARLTLPDFLEIKTLSDGTHDVCTKTTINQGTEFGPFQAKKLFTLNPCINFPLKIFMSNEADFSEYFLDTSDENECSWMIFISPASQYEEQNLICYQENDSIFYSTIRDVQVGEALKVWYAPYYADKMKKTMLVAGEPPEIPNPEPVDVNVLVQKQQKIMARDMWNCKFCGRVEKYVVAFANHLLDHYKAQMRKICEICKDVFATRKLLKKHLKIVHGSKLMLPINNHVIKDMKMPTLKMFKEQKENSVGGPLLNDMLTDSLDNSNLLLQQTDLNQFDIGNIEHQSILLESDNLNLSSDNLLNENVKALDHFNFELNDTEDQIICDICLKTFVKLRSLIQHLKQHTGQFHCRQCNKIFCRQENLAGHSCLKFFSVSCNLCEKIFYQKKYLTRHMNAKHAERFKCDKCNKLFCNKAELDCHNCMGVPLHEKIEYICNVCQKVFYAERALKIHLLRHQKQPKVNQKVICEICSRVCTSMKSYKNHVQIHAEPKHMCHICDKKFRRLDSLNNHLQTHSVDDFKEECSICKKKLKSKKMLASHIKSHSDEKNIKCSKCDATFKFEASLLKHVRYKHGAKVDVKKGVNFDVFDCPVCQKKMKLKSSLTRHLKRQHPECSDAYFANIKPRTAKLTKLPTAPKKIDNNIDRDDIDRKQLNIMETIDDMDFSDMTAGTDGNDINIEDMLNNSDNIDNFLCENSDKIVENLLNIASENGIVDKVDVPETREVCLSMPDLTESDQEIKLGRNAYILDNGTIVEPQENSEKVVIYVLDQKFS